MIKDKSIGYELLDNIAVLQEASNELYKCLQNNMFVEFRELSGNFSIILQQIKKNVTYLETEDIFFRKIKIGLIDNAVDSLERINLYEKTRSSLAFSKLEFELAPILGELYMQIYFRCLIYGDIEKEKKFNENEWNILRENPYIKDSIKTNEYAYDVSIVVIAYNQLKYTKQCIDSILKNTSSHIKYELILLNHGSSDGTKEYFESIGATKQLDLKYNELQTALPVYLRILEGKYLCCISNDILVGANYLDNMITCMESDPSIAFVVPTTPNIANMQTIPSEFSNIKEMYQFAKKNNISDPYRWERRTRLMDAIAMTRTADLLSSTGTGHIPLNIWGIAFNDDVRGIIINRYGGKSMLVKDAFCYHFGSVTLREESDYLTQQHVLERRKTIEKYYGVDPWGTGCCYDYHLFQSLSCKNQGHVKIMGINCGLGSNSLKVKESIKENAHNLDSYLLNITDVMEYELDQRVISDDSKIINNIRDIEEIVSTNKFHYIIFEDKFRIKFSENQLLKILLKSLTEDGVLAIRNPSNYIKKELHGKYEIQEEWIIHSK